MINRNEIENKIQNWYDFPMSVISFFLILLIFPLKNILPRWLLGLRFLQRLAHEWHVKSI